jgi:diacylglycerol kinase (ATP)
MTKTVQIVVTPGSGEGRAMGTARRLETLLKQRGYEARIRTFNDLPALVQWAKTCACDFAHLVCVGGDATLSAAAIAAVRCQIPFVPVPNGFGNLFARVFGHPDRAEAVVSLLETGAVRKVDVGAFDGALFLSHRSYGFLERIQQGVERERKQPRARFLRHLAYYGMARRLFSERCFTSIRVEVDGRVVAENAVLVTVANVETYRGFLSLTPKASPLDGMFDIFVVPRTSAPALGWRLLKLMFRLPRRWKGVALYRGREVVITTRTRREMLRVERRALPLLVPPGALESLKQRVVEEDAPVQGAA